MLGVIFLYKNCLYILITLKYIIILDNCYSGEKTMTKSVRDQIHAQISGALSGAKFPITSPRDLIAAFPNGADTTCQVGDLKMTAGEAGKLLKASDFPFKSAKEVADTIVDRAGL
jgi:hypothetical protein